jgi:hypothetical protein
LVLSVAGSSSGDKRLLPSNQLNAQEEGCGASDGAARVTNAEEGSGGGGSGSTNSFLEASIQDHSTPGGSHCQKDGIGQWSGVHQV